MEQVGAFLNHLTALVRELTVAPDPSDLLPVLMPAANVLLSLLPEDEPLKEKGRLCLDFLGQLLNSEAVPRDALELLLSKSIVSDEGLREDVESLLEALNNDHQIPESAFLAAALLLLVSYVTDCWPAAVVMSPSYTINFKRGTSTIIIDGSDSFALYDHGPEPSIYRTYHLSEIFTVLAQLGAQLSEL